MNQREQAIATIREALEYGREARPRSPLFDKALEEISALSEPGGEAEPVAWIYEDQLPDGYPYHIMFPFSEVRDGVRMFPVYAPLSADRVMEVVDAWAENDRWLSVESPDDFSLDTSSLRSRLSELGLK